MLLKLVPPQIFGKGWSVQANLSEDAHKMLVGLFGATNWNGKDTPSKDVQAFRAAHPFFQGGSIFRGDGWIMVEFWNRDETAVLAAAEAMGNWLDMIVV